MTKTANPIPAALHRVSMAFCLQRIAPAVLAEQRAAANAAMLAGASQAEILSAAGGLVHWKGYSRALRASLRGAK